MNNSLQAEAMINL